ncbi:hypothetical protein H9K76_03370 [Diaphorobacter ruginosibacter]|uniref:HTH luxR-type domain-containing protein n=1 Tax=Diaphorobacter ruginosibacter TaxID=1715720 RepID=A0A7G9RQQ6_9BURK|nr:hypothetical protein [Diaphorobacter ruginosibacter]QNN57931.1 hypothetical protein H9K76_03370 [Diaphorobacter ruginosibacter]
MTTSAYLHHQRLWHKLDLLCRLGLGLAPIAAEVCAVLRALVGADAAALFWLDEEGLPEGFHHEDSPPSVRNLFLNEFHLFTGPGETNILALARPEGPRVGRLLSPDAAHYRSNSHNLLMRPNGHHYTLDLRVEVPGPSGRLVTRAVAAVFRGQSTGFGNGFSAAEACTMERACASLQRAFRLQGGPSSESVHSATGHVLFEASTLRPLSADAQALQLLQAAHIRGLGLYGASATALPADLLSLLGLLPGQSRLMTVPQGLLDLRTRPLHSGSQPTAASTTHWLLTLQLQRPRQIDVVRRVVDLPLTPLQREIAVLAGLGHARSDSLALAGVSNAALKKHLSAILEVASASNWDELGRNLRA